MRSRRILSEVGRVALSLMVALPLALFAFGFWAVFGGKWVEGSCQSGNRSDGLSYSHMDWTWLPPTSTCFYVLPRTSETKGIDHPTESRVFLSLGAVSAVAVGVGSGLLVLRNTTPVASERTPSLPRN